MAPIQIATFADFEKYVGKEMGVSDYVKITQEQINQFASATLDHQWIHTDPERALTQSPFKATIAHGYLALALVPYLWGQIVEVTNIRMLINYGIESLKFNQPVVVNSEVRLRVTLNNITNLRGIAKAELSASLEIMNNSKPTFTATILLLYHFKK